MTKLNKTAVAEFLELKKERLEKLRNFIEIANEKSLYELADEAQKEANEIYKEIELVETVDNAIRTKEAGGFMAQFVELSTEDVEKANSLVTDFINQIEL